ncbi:MAG: anhydro-N-acetylmuramic acid kinase [Acidiferrobacteraceae bacterium]
MDAGQGYFIGLMSGTSADAIDAVLVEFGAKEQRFRLIATHTAPMPAPVRAAIEHIVTAEDPPLEAAATLDITLGELFAKSAQEVCALAGLAPSSIQAIGSHGQTLRHHPERTPPFTIQIGNPAVIAERSGITTVGDFRSRDLAAGGQGAPLVPAFHQWLFADPSEHRAVLNLGGIANLTILPPGGPVRGFDTGPANTLLDQWIAHHRKDVRYDENGDWAAQGTALPWLLNALLTDPYFSRTPPKSTGREHFNLGWVRGAIGGRDTQPEDVQATLAELTAATVTQALRSWAPATTAVYVCGGGRRNQELMRRLAAGWPARWRGTEELGLDAGWVEASAFAWLGAQTLAQRPGNVPTATGARRPVVLGAVYWR